LDLANASSAIAGVAAKAARAATVKSTLFIVGFLVGGE
jgi:hypothetical protein